MSRISRILKAARRRPFAVILGAVILAAQPAGAQGTADVVGRVSDASGAVLPGVMVTAENVRTNVGRTTIT